MSIRERTEALTRLEVGWDSYNAVPTRPEDADLAASIAERLADLFSSAPSIIPIEDGSCQVEWHCDGWDVEVYVSSA